MVVIPTNNFKLIQLPIELDDNNQLLFDNQNQQYNYFNSLPTPKYNSDFTYIRESGIVRYEANIEDIQKYNYCMYQNESYGNKWFYAFIDDMEYRNNDTTFIKIRTDYFQTWIYDSTIKKTFVEREHVSDDTFGKHTIPENIAHGEYVVSQTFNSPLPSNPRLDSYSFGVAISSNLWLSNRIPNPYQGLDSLLGKSQYYFPYRGGYKYNGLYQSKIYWGFPFPLIDSTPEAIIRTLRYILEQGQEYSVNNIFLFPLWLLGDKRTEWYSNADDYNESDVNMSGYVLTTEQLPAQLEFNINPSWTLGNSNLGTYTPRNNKCLTSQYNFLTISNIQGEMIKIDFEKWKRVDNQYKSYIHGMVNDTGCDIELVPYNYDYVFDSSIQGEQKSKVNIKLSPYPYFGFGANNYESNLDKLKGKSLGGMLIGGVGALGSIAIGNPTALAGSIMALATSSVAPILSESDILKNSFQKIGNDTTDLDSLIYKGNNFQIQRMSITSEYAKVIDDYFTMYGYKVNELKIPNLRSRVNFNYVKTIGCNLTGNIPRKAMEYIKSLFDNGITLWHNPSTYLDYGTNNIR